MSISPQAKGRAPELDFQTRSQIRSLREAGYYVNDICHRLRLNKPSERAAVEMEIDAMPRNQRFRSGIEVGGPVLQGRSMSRAILA